MKITQAFKMAFAAIFSNKMRAFLTMLGIIIGVLSVTLLIGVGAGSTSQVTEQISSLGTNLLTANIMSPKTVRLSLDDLLTLEEEPSIDHVAPVVSSNQTVKSGTNTSDVTVEGTVPSYSDIRNLPVENGRFIVDSDLEWRSAVAVLGVDVCDELYGTRNVVGNTLTIAGRQFTVVGVLEEQGSSTGGSNDERVIIPFTLAQRLLKIINIRTFYVSSISEDTIEAAEYAMNTFLLRKTGDSDYFNVFNQSSLLETMSSISSTMTLMLGGIASISLLVGGIGIMNIMLVSVTERTREIGIRKAIGAQRLDIMSQFLIESVTLSLAGGLIGLGLGYLLSNILAPILDMSIKMSASVSMLALGFSVAVGVIFGSYPANKASKLRPIVALRFE